MVELGASAQASIWELEELVLLEAVVIILATRAYSRVLSNKSIYSTSWVLIVTPYTELRKHRMFDLIRSQAVTSRDRWRRNAKIQDNVLSNLELTSRSEQATSLHFRTQILLM